MIADRLKSLLSLGKQAATSGPEERRGDPRRKVSLEAEVFPIWGCTDIKILNVSKTGFAGETTETLQPGHPVIFSMTENHFHQGVVRWTRGRKFGVDLDDALGILGFPNNVDPGLLATQTARPRRYAVELAGQIVVRPSLYSAKVLDVSQSGMRLELEAQLDVGQRILVRLPNRPLLLTAVRWRAYQLVGVETAERMETLRLVYACE